MPKFFILTLLFVVLGMSQVPAAIPEPVSVGDNTSCTNKQQKPGWIKRLAPASLFRHTQDSLISERPSKLARTAVVLLAASYAGTAVLGGIFMPLAYIGLAGILTANILAIIVLARNPNKKSRRYARGVLIITGIIIAAILLLLGALKLLFPGIH